MKVFSDGYFPIYEIPEQRRQNEINYSITVANSYAEEYFKFMTKGIILI